MRIDELARLLASAKQAEAKAVEDRRKIEDALVAELAAQGHESGTHKTDSWKFVVRRSETFKLDEKKWAQIQERIPEDLQPVKTKIEADAKGCKWLRDNDPALWALAAEAIEAREGRAACSVEEVTV
jgi:hypothetical protein